MDDSRNLEIQEYLQITVSHVESSLHKLGPYFEPPKLIDFGNYSGFRHQDKTPTLLAYLKCIRITSSLNAALLLLREGYVQEVGVLCRCIHDFLEDVLFVIFLDQDNGLSKDQNSFVKEFFQEEFSNPYNFLDLSQKRHRVPREKIQAAIASLQKEKLNPSDGKAMAAMFQKYFSGYVHGAYPHIMELYSSLPSHFHMQGMLNTSHISIWEAHLVSYVFQAIIVTQGIAKSIAAEEIVLELNIVRLHFVQTTNRPIDKNPETMMQSLKSKQRNRAKKTGK